MEDSLQGATESGQRKSPKTLYAFQVHDHSMASATSSTALGGSKAKRRRTSPRDHAILEAAYQKNSKPDKTERARIVDQVELGEKEVQIWFQNRRQNDRRRSKPLQPHELAAHLRNSTSSPVPPQVKSSPGSADTPVSRVISNSSLAPCEVIDRPASRTSSIRDLLNPATSGDTASSQETLQQGTQGTSGPSTPPSSLEEIAKPIVQEATPPKADAPAPEGTEKGSEVGSEHGSARKRGHDEMVGENGSALDAMVQVESNKAPARVKEPLKRTASMVRLSMTVDGAVKVRTNNEPTPSPEKPRAPPPASMQNKVKTPLARSQSAMTSIEDFHDAGQGTQSRPVGAGFGRSRDSRTWEFYCDSNTKDALSTQAEAETAGSAVSAINLIRTNSFKSRSQALSPSMSKTNSRLTPTSKGGKPKFARAKSSLGRLQGCDGTAEMLKGKVKRHGHVRSDSGDSDKENWAPGTRMSENPLRRTKPSARQRPILQENEEMTFPDAGSSQKLGGGKVDSKSSPTKEKAKGEELDCVQGLLSLSQGAWR
ncbi:hypothetical protein A1O1_06861 [Capronia coronata CBS 617.96]|uniref:Homeobox domain-containing protein n=1 Tax=Capronia coronata CBS 617.96 TaxID=1182541 RepID=W9XRP7_9EURO|nr:uncharacterized protein A1O1_06861 [Capronia coronata CBS 617.96]EXJ83242.1 hypothetical protein A1O1_06861 [Capronia coronata CBS 617.96]